MLIKNFRVYDEGGFITQWYPHKVKLKDKQEIERYRKRIGHWLNVPAYAIELSFVEVTIEQVTNNIYYEKRM